LIHGGWSRNTSRLILQNTRLPASFAIHTAPSGDPIVIV
jgi:hypothetical protein